MTGDAPQPPAETALYPAGHLESLSLDALIAERDRQWEIEAEALISGDTAAADEACCKAVAVETEIIRRGLIKMGAEEKQP